MNERAPSIKQAVLLPVALCILALIGLATAGFWRLMVSQSEHEALAMGARLEREIIRSIEHDAALFSGFMDFLASDPPLIAALATRDRVRLASLAGPAYERLNSRFRVTHLYFIDAQGTALLRMHSPSLFGDRIDRKTLRDARATEKEAHGLELGPLGSFSLRVVRPVSLDGHVIGFIEISEDIEHILPALARLLDVELVLTLDKRHLDRDSWLQGKGAQIGSDWDRLPGAVVVQSTLPAFPDDLARRLDPSTNEGLTTTLNGNLGANSPFVIETGERRYLAVTMPVKDDWGEPVARLAMLRDTSARFAAMQGFLVSLGLSGLVIALFLMLFINARIGRVEGDLEKALDSLRSEVEKHDRARSELAVATQRALAASRAKSEFLATMSHEIKTPLNGIIGFTEMTLESDLDPEQAQNLKYVLSSGRSLLAVVNDVLELSGIDAGRMEISTSPFALEPLVAGVRELFAPEASRKGLGIEAGVDEGLPQVFLGDPGRIRQVLVNLVGNAVKFTDQGGVRLRVQGHADKDGRTRLSFAVSDTGPGIAPDDLERIFEPFTQLEETRTRQHSGMGLGLALARRLAQAMDGEVHAESVPGRGSTFTLSLALPPADEGEDVPVPSAPARPRVLAAEDNPVNRHLVKRILEKLGYEAVLAADGQEAQEMLREGGFAAAILDLSMPRQSGVDVARAVRAGLAGPSDLPLLAVSAHIETWEQDEALAAGFSAFLQKPFSQDSLASALSGILAASREG
ncbi:integral membrane sensor hybrid histidine kinase [Alkalidesulfovibrio alkalitolerans DSM 16529]|uniref:histidine kinase n=1 Tax=Alkalidesulfovibrio alkalitolerans DSM 16529 TaxID=1121439 RepID=S7T8Y7_9BACT|nr:ATP-binding protein [Alkalidesulfovibrio alkalitolerans]EPR32985.1 integral membrane sensor hybrid histidine kinase [Alkalidesulfovibrio alkalitolerans DSM 16529]